MLVKLEDLYNGSSGKLSVEKNAVCERCKGECDWPVCNHSKFDKINGVFVWPENRWLLLPVNTFIYPDRPRLSEGGGANVHNLSRHRRAGVHAADHPGYHAAGVQQVSELQGEGPEDQPAGPLQRLRRPTNPQEEEDPQGLHQKRCGETGQRWLDSEPGGFARVTQPLIFHAGMKDGQKIVFHGEGDQEPGKQPGDLIVVLEQQKHPRFTRWHTVFFWVQTNRTAALFWTLLSAVDRMGGDLVVSMELQLVEALCGFKKPLQTLDNRTLLITSHPGDVTPCAVKSRWSKSPPPHCPSAPSTAAMNQGWAEHAINWYILIFIAAIYRQHKIWNLKFGNILAFTHCQGKKDLTYRIPDIASNSRIVINCIITQSIVIVSWGRYPFPPLLLIITKGVLWPQGR